jgi:ubiquinone biosynthesis protein UbiJ
MEKILDYTDETREAIIAEQKALGFILVEDQRHLDGNHLIFERDLASEVDEIKANIDDLKARVGKLEKK